MRTSIEFEASYSLLVVDLEDGESIKAEPGAMVTQQTVQMSAASTGARECSAVKGCFSSGHTPGQPRTLLLQLYGAIRRMPVQTDREPIVDTGHPVAFTEDVDYSIGKVGGIRSVIAGGEGPVMRFTGSGHVSIQTRNLQSLLTR